MNQICIHFSFLKRHSKISNKSHTKLWFRVYHEFFGCYHRTQQQLRNDYALFWFASICNFFSSYFLHFPSNISTPFPRYFLPFCLGRSFLAYSVERIEIKFTNSIPNVYIMPTNNCSFQVSELRLFIFISSK